jgi:hypothetical protein
MVQLQIDLSNSLIVLDAGAGRGAAIVGRWKGEIDMIRRCGGLKESSVTGAYTVRGRVASSTGTESREEGG